MRGDKNEDGKLNADEFPKSSPLPFSHFDKDKDGYVTRDELEQGGTPPQRPERPAAPRDRRPERGGDRGRDRI
jgi:hypothetical protein